MSLAISFGRVVKNLREELRLSQELLADKADLNRTYLGEVERGVAIPSLITIEKISKALNISVSDILEKSEVYKSNIQLQAKTKTNLSSVD
jgi:XRE family transcriptional regulator, regulator of sulfur utilization